MVCIFADKEKAFQFRNKILLTTQRRGLLDTVTGTGASYEVAEREMVRLFNKIPVGEWSGPANLGARLKPSGEICLQGPESHNTMRSWPAAG